MAWLIVCYAFLYAPIGFLIAFSFNASRLVTAWSGFSFRWYGTLAHDSQLITATLLSLRIATASATFKNARAACDCPAARSPPRWPRRWCCRR